jgi:hypothetical protein
MVWTSQGVGDFLTCLKKTPCWASLTPGNRAEQMPRIGKSLDWLMFVTEREGEDKLLIYR